MGAIKKQGTWEAEYTPLTQKQQSNKQENIIDPAAPAALIRT